MEKEYLLNRVATANEAQLVVILFEGLIENLEDAVDSVDKTSALAHIVSNCKNILAELLVTLKGGTEFSSNCRSLYLFVNQLITDGLNKKSKDRFIEAKMVITPIYEGWRELAERDEAFTHNTAVVTGLTYGKTQVNTYVGELNQWKKG